MYSHCCSPKSGVFAHTGWVWWEEERSLLPPPLGHRTFALEGGHDGPTAQPRGSWRWEACCSCQLQEMRCPQEDDAPQLHAVMLSTWHFPWLLPKHFKNHSQRHLAPE